MHDETRERSPFVPTIQVGREVPDFRLETYDPKAEGFGELRLSELCQQGKWTILFFYPADFTFV